MSQSFKIMDHIQLGMGFLLLKNFFVSLFDVLGPDCLVAGIGRVEGTQAQGDDPGEQVRDHCETRTSSHRGQKRLPMPPKKPLMAEVKGSAKQTLFEVCYNQKMQHHRLGSD